MSRSRIVIGLTLACLSAAAAAAQRPMTPIDLLEVPRLSEPQLSPDGRELVYVLAEADWKANKRIAHLWRSSTETGETIQLTRGAAGESTPRWSPDGEYIAFVTERGDEASEQIYLLPASGGEARRLTHHPTSVSNIAWSPDSETVYFLAENAKTDEEKRRHELQDDVLAFDEDWKPRHLWSIKVKDGSERRITTGDFHVRSYRLSRDGTRFALHRSPTPLLDDSLTAEVWILASDGTGATRVTDNQVPERGAELSPDNTRVLFISDANARFEFYYNRNLFIAPASGGAFKLLLRDMRHEVQSASWSADGQSIYFTANTGVRAELFRVDVASEELHQLTRGDHTVTSWTYFPKQKRHVYRIDEPTNAGDVWVAGEGAESPKRVTHAYDYLAEFELPRQEAIRWRGEDGVEVEGLLYYPLGYEEGQRYPLIVQTHGGPRSSDKFSFGSWSRYVQVQTAMGYVVLKPNYRGSTGYGDEFLRDMVGHYFRQSHLDVMTGVDYLIERGIADSDRMVKMGWSGGGHMTNKIITHTTRFKAASSGAGAVNWTSMYAQSDTRVQRTPWFGGTPWQEDAPIDLYWGHSPLKDIYKATTPTLVLVGANDERVPPPQSVELYRALKSNGVQTHLYMAPRGASRLARAAARAVQDQCRARLVRKARTRAILRMGRRSRRPGRQRTRAADRKRALTYMRYTRRQWLAALAAMGAPLACREQAPSESASAELTLRGFEPRSMLRVPQTEVATARFPAIDVHTHLTWSAIPLGPEPYGERVDFFDSPENFLAVMDRKNVATMVNVTGGVGDGLVSVLERYDRAHPGRFISFTEPSWNAIERVDFPVFQAEQIEKAHALGAKGIKLRKILGLYLRENVTVGALLPIDDARFDPMWETAGGLGMPVAIHISDPDAFFTPTDRFNERYDELSNHPDWSFSGKDFPSKEALLEARNRVFEKHPSTQFIALHVGNHPENLDDVSTCVDRYPNVFVEIGARIGELGRQPRRAKRFFEEYQDRILFGTDAMPRPLGNDSPQQIFSDELYEIYYRFLETEDEYFDYAPAPVPPQGRWRIDGLGLDDGILKKVYRDNAARLLAL